MKKHITRRRVATTIALLLLLLWWLWPVDELAHVHAIQHDLFGQDAQALSPEERQAKFAELRSEMAKLSPAQRHELSADRQKRMQDRMAHYFAMSEAEKKAYLDQQIDHASQMQQQMQANGGWGGNGGPGNNSSQSSEDREHRRQQHLDSTTPEFRAQMDQFRHDMSQRRQERGLAASPPR